MDVGAKLVNSRPNAGCLAGRRIPGLVPAETESDNEPFLVSVVS